MTTLCIILYTLSCIFCFCLGIRHLRKIGYIEQEDLSFMLFFSAIWPISLVLILVIKFFDWLENVVNK